MGVFSFLSDLAGSKKDEDPAAAPAVPAAPAPEAIGCAEGGGMPPAQAPGPAQPSPPQSPGDTPFTPPAAWQPDPMAQPKPETTHDKLEVGPLDPDQTAALQAKIVEVIRTVFDPEIPVDIYELGLIYDIIVDANRNVLVNMTLTSPACPSAQQLPAEVKFKVKNLPEVTDARVEVVWEPAWGKERMSEAAKLTLGFF